MKGAQYTYVLELIDRALNAAGYETAIESKRCIGTTWYFSLDDVDLTLHFFSDSLLADGNLALEGELGHRRLIAAGYIEFSQAKKRWGLNFIQLSHPDEWMSFRSQVGERAASVVEGMVFIRRLVEVARNLPKAADRLEIGLSGILSRLP
ncbi:MAG: hypothetical protein JSR55_05815 [Proteobacteria bacterium]|nr:hypothetical protein [Pseudomonadota bacterium]